MTKLLLIDGNSLLFRAYFGTAYLKTGILRSKDGTPTNAILTFNRMILAAIKRYAPTHLLVAFDTSKPTLRHAELETYKAGRPETPSDLRAQMPLVREMLQHMNIHYYQIEGYEADDVIATASCVFAVDSVIILSSDRDLLQLVNKRVTVISPASSLKDEKVYNDSNFVAQVGCTPGQIPDLKGLIGDSSDNLPGIRGIGPKGAIKLLTEFGTFENIYANLDKISESVRQKLMADQQIGALSKQLAKLELNMNLPFNLSDIAIKKWNYPALSAFYKRYDLNSLLREVDEMAHDERFSNLVF